ncbi:hypothetical protein AAF712_014896 [Marasmius tenuissimus]|uniref:Uncharacterized protein n=1 Tax=Marasmius tenuissimus TaxID=585030 RepID=A0ABR2ZAP6_9AGAR
MNAGTPTSPFTTSTNLSPTPPKTSSSVNQLNSDFFSLLRGGAGGAGTVGVGSGGGKPGGSINLSFKGL